MRTKLNQVMDRLGIDEFSRHFIFLLHFIFSSHTLYITHASASNSFDRSRINPVRLQAISRRRSRPTKSLGPWLEAFVGAVSPVFTVPSLIEHESEAATNAPRRLETTQKTSISREWRITRARNEFSAQAYGHIGVSTISFFGYTLLVPIYCDYSALSLRALHLHTLSFA